MSIAVQDFIGEVLRRWPPPKNWTEEQRDTWVSDVFAEFASEKAEVFEHALSVLKRQTRQYSGTPRIEDTIKAVNQAVRETAVRIQSEQLKLTEGAQPGQQLTGHWTKERVKLAYELIQTEPGRKAAKEGYIHSFWTYVIEFGEAPKDHAINAKVRGYTKEGKPILGLKEAARQHVENMEALARNTTPLGRRLYKWGTLVTARGMRLAEIAEGKNVPSLEKFWHEAFGQFEKLGNVSPEVQSTPASRYADVNKEEGRGWKGMTA